MRVAMSLAVLTAAMTLAACSKPTQTTPEQPAQPTEPASAPPTEPTPADIKAALADLPAAYQNADIDNGRDKFALCKACHTAEQGGADGVGPNLYGVFGRKAGTKAGFDYSDPVKAAGFTWDVDHLDKWLTNPAMMIPGTKMTFAGLPDPKDRTDVIAYLKVATSPRKGS